MSTEHQYEFNSENFINPHTSYNTSFEDFSFSVGSNIHKTYMNLAKHCVRINENFSKLQSVHQVHSVEENNRNYKNCKHIEGKYASDYADSVAEAKIVYFQCMKKVKMDDLVKLNFNCKKEGLNQFVKSLQGKESDLLESYLKSQI